MAKSIGTTKSNGRKDALDRFYTKSNVAAQLVNSLLDIVPSADTMFIEPSAGDGAFVKALEDAGINDSNIIAFDIAPSDNQMCKHMITHQDFLSYVNHNDNDKSVVVIGNPPFGEQGKLCFDFLKKSFEIADYVAFILPPSFEKESYKRRVGKRLITIVPIEDTQYRLSDALCDVPSKFFVYDSSHPYIPRKSVIGKLPFKFLSPRIADLSDVDFVIRRVGGTAGTASLDTDVSRESYYFCKIIDNHFDPKQIVEAINSCSFPERDMSIGPRSLSRDEIAWNIIDHFPNQ